MTVVILLVRWLLEVKDDCGVGGMTPVAAAKMAVGNVS